MSALHTFNGWLVIDPSLADRSAAFLERYGAAADQLMDRQTLELRLMALPEPAAETVEPVEPEPVPEPKPEPKSSKKS